MEVEESDNPACAGFVFSPRNPPQALRYWYFAGTRIGIANVFRVATSADPWSTTNFNLLNALRKDDGEGLLLVTTVDNT
jgi:hypothetical protein